MSIYNARTYRKTVSPDFILLGFTHATGIAEKALNRKLKRLQDLEILVKTLRYPDDLASGEIQPFIEQLVSEYPKALIGVICDANLGSPGSDNMTVLVQEKFANNPNIHALCLFTETEECIRLTRLWAKTEASPSERNKLAKDDALIVTSRSEIGSLSKALVDKLNEIKTNSSDPLGSFGRAFQSLSHIESPSSQSAAEGSAEPDKRATRTRTRTNTRTKTNSSPDSVEQFPQVLPANNATAAEESPPSKKP